jgi:hypothetical protein
MSTRMTKLKLLDLPVKVLTECSPVRGSEPLAREPSLTLTFAYQLHTLVTASLVLQLCVELAADGIMDQRPALTSAASFLGFLYKRRVTSSLCIQTDVSPYRQVLSLGVAGYYSPKLRRNLARHNASWLRGSEQY